MAAIMPVMPVGSEALPASTGIFRPESGAGFADMIASGLASVDARVARADALIAGFAQGDSIPVHAVTMALEQARLSVELAAQVRTRLLEAYRDFMNMQL